MIYIRSIFVILIILFFLINLKLLLDVFKAIFYSIIGKKYLPKKIIIFGKEIKNLKKRFIYKNFILLSWIIIIIFIALIFASNLKLTTTITECDFELLQNYDYIDNCIKTKNTYIQNVKIPNITSPQLGYYYNTIIIIGDYDNLQTKEMVKTTLDIYSKNPNNIKYSYINAKNTNKSKIMNCVELLYPEKYWAIHMIFISEVKDFQENIENIFLRLNIDKEKINQCIADEFLIKSFENKNIIINNSNIFAIPTIIINEKIFVGNINIGNYIN